MPIKPLYGELADHLGRVQKDLEVHAAHIGQRFKDRNPFLCNLAGGIDSRDDLERCVVSVPNRYGGELVFEHLLVEVGAGRFGALEQPRRNLRDGGQAGEVGKGRKAKRAAGFVSANSGTTSGSTHLLSFSIIPNSFAAARTGLMRLVCSYSKSCFKSAAENGSSLGMGPII